MSDTEQRSIPFSIYCNQIEFGYSPWDIRLVIKEMTDVVEEKPVIKKHGTIVMSPAHAKAAVEALQRAISIYEAKFGEIDLSKINETVGVPHESPL